MQNKNSNRIWKVREYDKALAAEIADELGICTNTAALLCERGVENSDDARKFLNKESCCFYNPFLLKDMDRAVERIAKAISEKEKICVYGDYDVDGITATSLMCLYLEKKGIECIHYIPKRNSEGYGVNAQAIESIAKSGAKLVITVDTGVTAVEEIEKGKALGLSFVVTDHHECRETIPDAIVVNPCRKDCEYPYKSLAGVGVVFKLICALEMELCGKRDEIPEDLLKGLLEEYSQLVALGTVADVMPATDENRLIISVGLAMMQKAPDPWCVSLLEFNGFYGNQREKKQITTSTIGYMLAPRINAAGRIGDVETAVNLFLTKSKAEADSYAAELSELNRKRQQMENEILEEAIAMLEQECSDDPFIVLASDNWHQGIIGIVASRISEKYCRPCILITYCDEDTLSGKGSGRSVSGINIYEALESCGDLLVKYGGHELAAGLTIDRSKFESFKEKINEYTRKKLAENPQKTVVEIDREPESHEITLRAAKELRLLEPFGYGNPSPVFLISDAVISDIVPMGNDKHCKFLLTKDGCSFEAVYFGVSSANLGLCSFDTVDAVFSMEPNTFGKSEKLQLIIKDIRISKALIEDIEFQEGLYRKFHGREALTADELDTMIPSRDDFKNVYLHIMRMLNLGVENIDYTFAARRLSYMCNTDISACKFRIIMDIFREKELIDYDEVDENLLKVTKSGKIAPGEKVSLDGSQILCLLREMRKQV